MQWLRLDQKMRCDTVGLLELHALINCVCADEARMGKGMENSRYGSRLTWPYHAIYHFVYGLPSISFCCQG